MIDWHRIGLSVVSYYGRTRGVGHSSATLNGVYNHESVTLVTETEKQAHDLMSRSRTKFNYIPIERFVELSRGVKYPMLFDNAAIVALVNGLLQEDKGLYFAQQSHISGQFVEIMELLKENTKLKDQLHIERSKTIWQRITRKIKDQILGE